MGPSGCGKSTLLNLMGGIDKPSAGQVWFDGQELTALSDEQTTRVRGTKIGFIFQFFNLLSTLTVLENVSLPLELVGRDERECRKLATEMLARVGLEKRVDFYPSQLSGGEMQRTAIARALIHRPSLILADEPTGNLDSENGTAVLEMLRSVNSEFKPTIIMATHSQEAANYADELSKCVMALYMVTSKNVLRIKLIQALHSSRSRQEQNSHRLDPGWHRSWRQCTYRHRPG